MKKRAYISGQITGLTKEEVEKNFSQAVEFLTAKGYEAVNPLNNGLPDDASWQLHMIEDIKILITCQVVFMLRNWRESKGARIEKQIAEASGIKVIYQTETVEVERYAALLDEALSNACGLNSSDCKNKLRTNQLHFVRLIYSYYAKDAGMSKSGISYQINRSIGEVNRYLRNFCNELNYNKEFRGIVEKVDIFLSKKVLP